MKFTATAVLLLAGSWSAAEPSWEERSLQEAFVPDGYGPRGSYGGPSYKPYKEPNGWIIQNFQGMPGSGFEVEVGHLIDFESVTPRPPMMGKGGGNKSRSKPKTSEAEGDTVTTGATPAAERGHGGHGGHGGKGGGPPPTPEGICSVNLCYNNVYAIVKGNPIYDGYEVKGESIKLCLVDSGDSCWSVTCPSAKLRPIVREHGCYEADSYCWCDVDYTHMSYNTVKICVRTMDHRKCGILKRVEDAEIEGKGCCAVNETALSAEHCSSEELFDAEGKKKGPQYCNTGSVATVEIECQEPYYD